MISATSRRRTAGWTSTRQEQIAPIQAAMPRTSTLVIIPRMNRICPAFMLWVTDLTSASLQVKPAMATTMKSAPLVFAVRLMKNDSMHIRSVISRIPVGCIPILPDEALP